MNAMCPLRATSDLDRIPHIFPAKVMRTIESTVSRFSFSGFDIQACSMCASPLLSINVCALCWLIPLGSDIRTWMSMSIGRSKFPRSNWTRTGTRDMDSRRIHFTLMLIECVFVCGLCLVFICTLDFMRSYGQLSLQAMSDKTRKKCGSFYSF